MTAAGADRRLFGFAAGVWAATLVGLRVSPATVWVTAGLAAGGVGLLVGVHVRRARPRTAPRAARPCSPRWPALAAMLRTRAAPPATSGSPVRAAYRPRHRRAVGVWALAAVVLGAVCGFVATAARTVARDAPALTTLARQQPFVGARLVVSGDPRILTRTGSGTTTLVPARMTEVIAPDGTRLGLDVRVLVFARDPAWGSLLPSQAVRARGQLEPARGGDLTAAVLSVTGPPESVSDPQWTQSAAGTLRAGLRRAAAPLPPGPAGLLPGLSIGDTSLLDPGLEEDFRTTGLSHLTAVSGANTTIVVGCVLLLARWLRAGPWPAAAVALLALAGFVILARPTPSVVRAAAMGAVGLLALVAGRSRVATAALATAVVGSLLVDPALAVSVGFLLSVLATGALVLLAPGWRDRLRAAGVPPGLAEALAIPAAAQLACAPVVAALSGEVSLVALPANLLVAPAVAPVTVLGVAAAVVSPVSSDAAGALAWLGAWPARWIVAVAHAGAGVPAGTFAWASGWPGALSLAALGGCLWIALRRPAARRLIVVLVLAAAAGAVPVRWLPGGWPPVGAVVVACDVGQGDAIVLPDGDGSAVVVDAGPEPAPVDACLRRLGVATVDVLVLSHFHADHVDGIVGVLRGRPVGAVVVPTFDAPAGGEARVRAAARGAGVPVHEIGPQWTLRAGGVEITVIGPTRTLSGTHSDPNNNSLVLLARVRGISILLTGDAEVEQQRALLRDVDPAALLVDVLKVAHHGSSYQDSELLAATGARVALVSVGADNPYGHPNPALLQTLADAGMRILRTDLHGDVAVVATANGLGVATRR